MLKLYLSCLMAFISISLLSSCASVNQAPTTAANEKLTWQTRSAKLSTIEHYVLTGAIAIRKASDAWSANINLQQSSPYHYQVTFIAPMGAGTTRLTGEPGKVTLQDNKGKEFTANTAEQLLRERMGWNLPVSNLYFWIKGLPSPSSSTQQKFDNAHHLLSFDQSGWHISYAAYTSAKGLDLPSKIILTRDSLKIKLIINQWQNIGFFSPT